MVRMRTYPAATVLFLFFLTFSRLLHFISSKPTGLSFRLIPRDSPESPLYPGNLTGLERIERMIKFSDVRAAYLESSSTPSATVDAERIVFTLLREGFYYIVQVGIGSPPLNVFLLMDTGGGLIWTQCQPCKNCYRQQFPIYNSVASSTYRKLPCDHPLCQGDNNLYKCVDQQCVYSVGYGGGGTTKGVASFESFRFATDSSSATTVDNIIFGCSNDNQNIQFASRGVISGILGLSSSPDSIVMQLSDVVDKRFSYCLVPFTDALMAPSIVKFGNDIPPLSGTVQATTFVPPPGSFYYHLSLIDISVGTRRLGFAPDTFRVRPDGQGGCCWGKISCIIDSGVIIPKIDQTTVGRNAYRAVMGAFQNYYDALKLERIGRVPEGLQLCYTNPPGFNNFASFTYHFDGASYDIEGKFVNLFNVDQGYFCVALQPGNGRTILGAWHQQNKRLIYNSRINALQFYTDTCSNDTPP
ncbi:aspartic proteinase CDR1-like [Citrus sinensis]|uniref:aspartic proteinase CDR1-like n=1 Tax=Citrus sinensis TaxID=2711 RepID=UPI002279C804|nr:aspartic proteinase CDR1-like [Citrus sinensis]